MTVLMFRYTPKLSLGPVILKVVCIILLFLLPFASEILVYSNLRIKDEGEAAFKTEAVDRRPQNKTEDLPPDAAAPFEAAEVAREFVKCRWRGCGLDVEDLHLLEHLQVHFIFEV